MPDMQKGPKVGHTPGPWVLAEDHDREDDEHIVVLAKRRANYRGLKGLWPVCLVGYGLDLEDDKRWLAQCRTNARLIAAAPELLEQAKLFSECVAWEIGRAKRDGDDEGAWLRRATLDRLLAVIAKAEGA